MTSAIKIFYKKYSLYPGGLAENLPAVAEWAAKSGEAVARLVTALHYCSFVGFLFVFVQVFQVFKLFKVGCPLAKASRFRPLHRRSGTSKNPNLQWIRDNLKFVPRFKLKSQFC